MLDKETGIQATIETELEEMFLAMAVGLLEITTNNTDLNQVGTKLTNYSFDDYKKSSNTILKE